MKKYLIIVSLFLLPFVLFADDDPNDKIKSQESKSSVFFNNKKIIGFPFAAFFDSDELVDKQIFGIVQDSLGRYILANRRGLTCFNSLIYTGIKTSSMPHAIATDPYSKKIFVACNSSIGYLESLNYKYHYSEIRRELDKSTGNVDIFFTEKQAIFYYKDFFIIYSKDNSFLEIIKPKENQEFGGIIQKNNKIYVLLKGQGLFEISENKISDKLYYPLSENLDVTFSISLSGKSVFGLSNGQIFISENNKFTPVDSKKIEYLKDKIITKVIKIEENIIAISTLNGGVIFFDINEQKIIYLLNNYSGLYDNEVYTIFKDDNFGLLLSNNYGLTRYDLSLPIYDYSSIMGLHGNIMNAYYLDTTLYVLTTQGVYYLSKVKSEEEIKNIDKNTRVRSNKKRNKYIETTQQEIKKVKRKLHLNIFKKKDKKKKDKKKKKKRKKKKKKKKSKKNKKYNKNNNVNPGTNDVLEEENEELEAEEFEKPPSEIIKLYYVYKKIPYIKSKCKEAFEVGNKLLVSSNRGLYWLNTKQVRRIIRNKYVTKVTRSSVNKNSFYVATVDSLYKLDFLEDDNYEITKITSLADLKSSVFSIEDTQSDIWLGGNGYVYKISKNDYSRILLYTIDLDFVSEIQIKRLNPYVYFFAPQGIYKYNQGIDSITPYNKFSEIDVNSIYFINNQKDYIWSRQNQKYKYYCRNSSVVDSTNLELLHLFPKITNITVDKDSNLWVVSNNNSLYKIDINEIKSSFLQKKFNLAVKDIYINDSYFESDSIYFPYQDNIRFKVDLEAPYFVVNEPTKYQYAIQKDTTQKELKWTKLSTDNHCDFPLEYGTYNLYFRAVNAAGQQSDIKKVSVTIPPPFLKTNRGISLVIFGLVIIGFCIFYIINHQQRKRNNKLKKLVAERTLEIQKKNDDLEAQSKAIKQKNLEIKNKNQLVTEQRDKIKGSYDYIKKNINYASRIQYAMLPRHEKLQKYFSESFIISRPKDVVSGDFYWFKNYKDKFFLAVADCTGHGVSGALLSMLGMAYLNEIIVLQDNISSAKILETLRTNIIKTLKGKDGNVIRDGMDMSLIIIDQKTQTLQYSGAYNTILMWRRGDLTDLKVDRMPIGFGWKNDVAFTEETINIEKGDIFYLFTDGYLDQFGGPHSRKYFIRNFKNYILSIAEEDMQNQKIELEQNFDAWRGERAQIDDVTVVGVKI